MRRRRLRGLLDHWQSAPFPKVLEENQSHQLPRIYRYRRASSALLNPRHGNWKRDKRKTPPLQKTDPQGWATQRRFWELRRGHRLTTERSAAEDYFRFADNSSRISCFACNTSSC